MYTFQLSLACKQLFNTISTLPGTDQHRTGWKEYVSVQTQVFDESIQLPCISCMTTQMPVREYVPAHICHVITARFFPRYQYFYTLSAMLLALASPVLNVLKIIKNTFYVQTTSSQRYVQSSSLPETLRERELKADPSVSPQYIDQSLDFQVVGPAS